MDDWTNHSTTTRLSRKSLLVKTGAAAMGAAAIGALPRPDPAFAAGAAPNSVMTRKAAGSTITVWGWDAPAFNKVVEDYIQQAAGVTIHGETFANASLPQKETIAAAAGVGLPDAFKANTNDIPRLVSEQAIRDITDLVAPYKDLLPAVGWKEVTYQGKIWAVPANSPAGGMFWRYDMLKKYGLDPTRIHTWDDLISMGKQVTKASGGKVSILNGPAIGINATVFPVIQQQFRAQLIGSDLKVKIGPQSSPWLNTLALAQRIRTAQVSAQIDDWTQPWYQAIKSGSVAAFPSGTWFVETLIQQAPDTQHDWYFTPFPAAMPGGDRYPFFGSAVCLVSSQTQNVAAAFEWVKAWTLDPHGTLALGLKQLGISVISNAALTDSYVNTPHPYFALGQRYWRDATEAFFKTTYIPPTTPYDAEAADIFNRHIADWWNGKASNQAFLQGTADELRSKLKLS